MKQHIVCLFGTKRQRRLLCPATIAACFVLFWYVSIFVAKETRQQHEFTFYKNKVKRDTGKSKNLIVDDLQNMVLDIDGDVNGIPLTDGVFRQNDLPSYTESFYIDDYTDRFDQTGVGNGRPMSLSIHEPMRRLPQAIVIGVRRCGTKALHAFLNLHPDIRSPEQEVRFFDKNYHKGLEWYRYGHLFKKTCH